MADTSQQLVEQVASAYADHTPLCIVGGNSKSFIGRNPSGEMIEAGAHSGIISYQPTELVLTARCGTTLDEIAEALSAHAQHCPFESPRFDGRATLGGTLATNLSGPSRPWLGSIRDAVLGIRLINGRGKHLKFGGQVMKNVAGYDVSRLQAGALGTLGLMTEISIKVLPEPATSATRIIELDAAEALEMMNSLSGRPLPLTAAAWLDGRLHLRFAGAERAVESAMNNLPGEALQDSAPFWSALGEQQLDFFAGDAPLWRFSQKPNTPLELGSESWLLDWGGAQRWLRGSFDRESLEQLAQAAGGHVTLYRHGNRNDDLYPSLSTLQRQIHSNLKTAFDPKGIFNPGRLYSWL